MGEGIMFKKKYFIHPSLKTLARTHLPVTWAGIRLLNTKHRLLAPTTATSDQLVAYFREEYPRADGSTGHILRIKPHSLRPDAPALVYFPGGGFTFAPAPHHYRLARQYALECGCQVLVADYRLLPDHDYPTPAEDAYAAWKWVNAHASGLLLDHRRIAVGGDGAGACLAVSCALKARDERAERPCFQLVLSPILNRLMTGNSFCYNADAPVWNKAWNERMWRGYQDMTCIADIQYASPAYEDNLKDMPPAYVELVNNSAVYSDAANYWGHLESAGVAADLNTIRDGVHGFDSVADSPVTREAVSRRIAALKHAFSEK